MRASCSDQAGLGVPRSPSPITSTAFDRQVVRLHRLSSAIGACVLDVAQRNFAKGDGPASDLAALTFGSFRERGACRDRATALIEDICNFAIRLKFVQIGTQRRAMRSRPLRLLHSIIS